MYNNKNLVLVPVNFSEEAENGAVYALQIAAGINANIVLLNAYFNPALYVPGMLEPFSNLINIEEDIRSMEKEAEINLVALKQMLDEKMKKENLYKTNVCVYFKSMVRFARAGKCGICKSVFKFRYSLKTR